MAKRIVRKKLDVKKSADVLPIPSQQKLVVAMDKGNDIDIPWLDDLDQAQLISKELNIFLKGQAAKRAVANNILPYLKYVSMIQGYICSQSLKDFRKILDNKSNDLNTKAQQFSTCLSFVKHLMSALVIPFDDLPSNFSYKEPIPKDNFVDVCRYDLKKILIDREDEIQQAQDTFKLDRNEAMALVFSQSCMNKIEIYAEQSVKNIFEDWEYIDAIINDIDPDSIEYLREINSYKKDFSNRTIELAISILYTKFGRLLPASTKWPDGIADFCKYRGWIPSRIKGAFFPTMKTLDSFLVIALANHDLLPNVSSVAFYAYTDCCKPSHDKGFTSIHFGKKRGDSKTQDVSDDDYIVTALQGLSQRIKTLLPRLTEGQAIFSQEFVPIMLHYTPGYGNVIRTVDPSSTSDMVARFIKNAAKEYPELENLVGKVKGENFRPTHTYIKKLSGESNYKIKNNLGHSNLSTTEGYVSGVETKSLQNRKHMDFQQYLIDESTKFEKKRTGSGYLCDTETEDDSSCIDLLGCSECDAKRIVFEDVEITAEWIAWEKAILNNQTRLEYDNPSRWESFWKPKLVEFQSLLALSKKRVLSKAESVANNLPIPHLD